MDTNTLLIAGLAFVVIACLGFLLVGGDKNEAASKRAKQIASSTRSQGKLGAHETLEACLGFATSLHLSHMEGGRVIDH